MNRVEPSWTSVAPMLSLTSPAVGTESRLHNRTSAGSRGRIPLLLCAMLAAVMLTMLSAPSIADHGAQAESELQAGINALGRGALEAAARSFTDAATSAEHDRAPDRQAVALLYLAQTKVGLGLYREAISALRTALAVSQSAPGNAHLVAGALSSLGEISTVVGPPEMAEQVLGESLAMARAYGQELIAAGALNGIASVYYQTGRIPEPATSPSAA